MLRENFPAVTTAQDEEFQDFHRQDGGRFSCGNCQTVGFVATQTWVLPGSEGEPPHTVNLAA